MIKPYQSAQLQPRYVDDEAKRARLQVEIRKYAALTISSGAAANAVMLGAGYFTPLTGFMSKADALSVAVSLQTTEGLFWPVPILNLVRENSLEQIGRSVALCDPNIEGHPVLAIQEVDQVEELSDAEMGHIASHTFGTADPQHPGVAALLTQGRYLLSGPIRVIRSVQRGRYEVRSNSVAGNGWWRFRHAIPCIARTKNYARWQPML